MFSLESSDQGDSNEYKQHAIFKIKKENHTKLSQNIIMSAAKGCF